MTQQHLAASAKPDKTGNLIVALVGTVMTGLVSLGGTVEVIRSLEEFGIKETYNVSIRTASATARQGNRHLPRPTAGRLRRT